MSPLKSVLAAVAVGLVAFFVATNVAGEPNGVSEDLALGASAVTPSANASDTRLALGAKAVTPSAKSLTPSAKVVTPSATPFGTPLALVTPRPTTPLSPSPSPTLSLSPSPSKLSTPTPTSSPVVPRTTTPTPSPSTTPTTSPATTISPSPTPTPTPTPSVTPSPTPAGTAHVVINEVAWAGTATSSTDEWVELYNFGTGPQELDGWSLCDAGGAIVTFTISHRLESQRFFLIERGDDRTISDISADYTHSFGSGGLLNSPGEYLTLRSGSCADGPIIDEVGPGKWYGGSASPNFASMERISAQSAGNDALNWTTWGTVPDSQGNVNSTGLDAASNPIRGTPKYKNSVSN